MQNMKNLMKEAQKMQAKMAKMQEELKEETITGQSGGGMVKVVVNGQQEVLSLDIEQELWDENDREMLQDLVIAAVNDGLSRSREVSQEKMSRITGGFNLPGFM